MTCQTPAFKINDYDSDGDIIESGVYLCFDFLNIKVANHIKGFYKFVDHINKIKKEIEENYYD